MSGSRLLLAGALALAGCRAAVGHVSAQRLEAGLATAQRRGAGTRVALGDVAGSGWQQVYVFGPYTPAAAVARCLGREAGAETQGIESRDDATLLVFQFPGGRVQGVAVRRSAGDFAPEALRRAYSPEQAVFVVRRPPTGSWGDLAPAGGLTNRCS